MAATQDNIDTKPMQKPEFLMMAPMEGVIDHTMRDMFTAIGGLDRCVTEFVRVSGQVLPAKVFYRFCPELKETTLSCTKTGIPVYVQLLGDKPGLMAANAARASELGAAGIDINFGCPAKTVNNHGGGSVLLQDPEILYLITKAIRDAVDKAIPVTAKIRLGFHDKTLARENIQAIAHAGANEIAIHARTKVEGYRPPAHWSVISEATKDIHIPVIANGEVWTLQDLQQCMTESNCSRVMLGRGLLACPDLALLATQPGSVSLHWGDICLLLLYYLDALQTSCEERYRCNLVKQWLVYLRIQYGEAHLFFEKVKRIRSSGLMHEAIQIELLLQMQRRSVKTRIGSLEFGSFLDKNCLTTAMAS